MFLGNPEDSVWEDWGTLRNIRDDYGNHHAGTLKNPIMNRATATKPTNDIPVKLPSLVHKDPWFAFLVSAKLGIVPSLKLTASLHLKIGRAPKGNSYSNHPFSGAMLVSGRVAL